MKKIMIILNLMLVLFAGGCATSSYSVGQDFPSQSVSRIIKGETTGSTLVHLFGEPFSKTIITETKEKWIYTYFNGTAYVQSYFLIAKVQMTGQQKTLQVLLEKGVVAKFTFTEGPGPVDITVQ